MSLLSELNKALRIKEIKRSKHLFPLKDSTFRNKDLLMRSLVHKSFDKIYNNEKLEFLGDRVLGLALSKKLFNLYPEEDEGVLDKRFSKLVNRQTCASVAWSIGIKDFVI